LFWSAVLLTLTSAIFADANGRGREGRWAGQAGPKPRREVGREREVGPLVPEAVGGHALVLVRPLGLPWIRGVEFHWLDALGEGLHLVKEGFWIFFRSSNQCDFSL